MKQVIASFFILTLMLGCGDEASQNSAVPIDETPKVLQDGRLSQTRFSLSKSRKGSILDAVYFEIIRKDKKLLELDSIIKTYLQVDDTLYTRFENYNHKSYQYYNEVKHKRGKMQDTILSARLDSIIAKSMRRYDRITKETDTLIYQVKDLSGDISDRYHFLKVMITLPVMEKFQQDHLPSNKSIEKYLKQQQEVKSKINDKAKID